MSIAQLAEFIQVTDTFAKEFFLCDLRWVSFAATLLLLLLLLLFDKFSFGTFQISWRYRVQNMGQ